MDCRSKVLNLSRSLRLAIPVTVESDVGILIPPELSRCLVDIILATRHLLSSKTSTTSLRQEVRRPVVDPAHAERSRACFVVASGGSLSYGRNKLSSAWVMTRRKPNRKVDASTRCADVWHQT